MPRCYATTVAMATASWGHVGDMIGCDHPSFIQICPLIGEYSVSNILQYGGHPPSWIWILLFWTTHKVNYVVRLPRQNMVSIRYSSPVILRFYNFASLAEKCLTTAPFWGFLKFEPLNIVGSHRNLQKAHPWVTTRHLSHKWLKSVQGFELDRVARKKYNQDMQDRTGQQKSHKSVFHIFGGKLPVKILQ